MTMPKGWDPKKKRKHIRGYGSQEEEYLRKLEEQQRKQRQKELEKLDPRSVDYYYTVVKPQISKPGITPEEYSKILAEYGEAKAKVDWNEVEAKLKAEKKTRKLDYTEKKYLKQAQVRRKLGNYNGWIPPEKLGEKITYSRDSKTSTKDDALFALGIVGVIVAAACFIIGLINLNYWYLMIPGFVLIFLMFALSGGGGHHEGAAHYWRSSRGRTFRMLAANRRNR